MVLLALRRFLLTYLVYILHASTNTSNHHLIAQGLSTSSAGFSSDRQQQNQQEICTNPTANNDNDNDNKMSSASKEYAQDGPEAQEIAQYLPYFPFKGIPRFYDIGGFLYEPAIFQKIVNIFADRYSNDKEGLNIDIIAGLDARGFVLGPPIALALKKPFIMMRKQGKMPNSVSSSEYETEYGS